LYNFPIWLRKFTYKRIEQRQQEKQEAQDKQNNIINPPKDKIHRPKAVNNPPQSPIYKTRAPKK
jgi:hypothetical protein